MITSGSRTSNSSSWIVRNTSTVTWMCNGSSWRASTFPENQIREFEQCSILTCRPQAYGRASTRFEPMPPSLGGRERYWSRVTAGVLRESVLHSAASSGIQCIASAQSGRCDDVREPSALYDLPRRLRGDHGVPTDSNIDLVTDRSSTPISVLRRERRRYRKSAVVRHTWTLRRHVVEPGSVHKQRNPFARGEGEER